MGVNSVNNTTYTTGTSTSRNATSELGKEQFLNLLITQLRYQDPLSPLDNTEYVSQLAQFSALEQMSNMSTGISSMQALNMTGKMITASVTDATTGETTEVQGVVDSVKMKSGKATLLVNGTEINLEDVTKVYEYNRSDVANLSALLGQKCEGYVYDSDTLNVVKVNGTVTGIEKGTYEDYAVMDGVECTLDSILSDDYKSSQDKLTYLQEHVGEEIDIKIKSGDTGKTVPVTAVLESVTKQDGTIKVTLNSVKVPVDGIYNVTKNT